GRRRRRPSFNRDRRCSFPELGANDQGAVGVGYSPRTQPDEVSVTPAGVGSGTVQKSRHHHKSQSFIRKYLLCCCCCCGGSAGGSSRSYNPTQYSSSSANPNGSSTNNEDPATISSRVYQHQHQQSQQPDPQLSPGVPNGQQASGDAQRLPLAQLLPGELI